MQLSIYRLYVFDLTFGVESTRRNQGLEAERVEGRNNPVAGKIYDTETHPGLVNQPDIPHIPAELIAGLEMAFDLYIVLFLQTGQCPCARHDLVLHVPRLLKVTVHFFAIERELVQHMPVLKMNADPGQQLRIVDRFADHVSRTRLENLGPILRGIRRRLYQNRQEFIFRVGTQCLADIQPVHPGHLQIEDDKVRILCSDHVESFIPVAGK